MEANGFLAKLKANESEKGLFDLNKVYEEYKTILLKLSTKDKGTLSLNVLCVMCRNLDKAPHWRDSVNHKELLILCIDCVRATRSLGKEDRVKTVACIYHIHKHVVKQTSPIPPELVLKFSYMPFECESNSLLSDYHKTYWSLIVDRLSYIERLKSNRLAVTKLLPKLLDDVLKIIGIYDITAFCANLLVFLVKKLQFIFNDSFTELTEAYAKIFEAITKRGCDSFKDLKEKVSLDLYVKFNETFVVVTECFSKTNFKGCILDDIVRNCISLLGSNSDIFHCLQTFYLNSFCCIFKPVQNSCYVEAIFKNLVIACETTEKLGYKAAMYATYPYLNQLLRIYIECKVIENVESVDNFDIDAQVCCLKFMSLLMKKLRKSNQLLKCDNCSVKSGLHDALRLSFLVKNFINLSVAAKIDLKSLLPHYFTLVESQYCILYELRSLGCSNFAKCFRKLQTDIHNTAITLNKAQYYDFSIKIFDLYLVNEIKNFKSDVDLKNICRGLYNKSICELDCKLHEQALNDAYLSLVLGNSEPSTDKYMSLVMDIKAKMLKSSEMTENDDRSVSEVNQDYFQMLTVLDVTKVLLEKNLYGDLKQFVRYLKFSTLLRHEFSMYVKLWPSIVPIAGVWRSLNDMAKEKHLNWIPVAETRENLLMSLYEIVLETPTVVRTIHSDYFKEIIMELVENLEEKSVKSSDEQVILATLKFLKAEYDLTEASQNHGWKAAENTVDPDLGQAIRTLPQEHRAIKSAIEAVEIWTCVIKDINKPTTLLNHALQVAEMFVKQFLHMQSMVHALQLASICCRLALILNERPSYIRNACAIISNAERESKFMDTLISTSKTYVSDLLKNKQNMDLCMTFVCDLAIYYNKLDLTHVAAKLVGYVQKTILEAFETTSNIKLDLSLGRLLEAQYEVFGEKCDQTILSVVNNIHRHYIAVANNGSTFTSRRLRATYLKHASSVSGVRSINAAFRLRLLRRARATAAVALPRATAATQAMVYCYITNVANVEDTQIKIDNRLKHILGLQPTNEIQPYSLSTQCNIKHETFTPKTANFETMLDCVTFKKAQTSPSLPCTTIPAFKMPEFFDHNSTCECYACSNLMCDLLSCYTCGLEAAMYFRAKELVIARNYYEGALKMFEIAEGRFKNKMAGLKTRNYDSNILEIVGCVHRKLSREMTIEFLIDASLFELAQNLYEKSDDLVVRIHEIMSEMRSVDPYLKNDVYNLMIASANVRRVVKLPELGLESDFDALKLSPDKDEELVKTPESKFVPEKKAIAKVVNPDEVPNVKRKVIKLNLDENLDEVEAKPKRNANKTHFKIPVPVIAKPVIETVTPRPSRSKPSILLTQATVDVENTPKANEFFTPLSTPNNELFFTPMTSVKTYGKKSHIVKKLEAEFATPKSVKKSHDVDEKTDTKSRAKKGESTKKVANGGKDNKEITEQEIEEVIAKVEVKEISAKRPEITKVSTKTVEIGSVKTLREKRTLKRATSPGKLTEEDGTEKVVSRSRRRQLVLDNKRTT